MYQLSNGSLRVAVLLGALSSGVTAAVAGCPGPAPTEAPGGAAGATASSSSSSSTSGTTTATTTNTDPCAKIQEECAPAPGGGWSAPFEVHTGTTSTPPCAMPTLQGYSLPTPVAAKCDACTCGSADGGLCDALTVAIYAGSSCTGPVCASGTIGDMCSQLTTQDPTCITGATAGLSVSVTANKPNLGSCTGSQPDLMPTKPLPYNVIGCPLATPVSCALGTCVPTESGLTDVAVCVMQSGAVDCSGSFYTKQTLVYPNVADSRVCSQCVCGAAMGGACGGGLVAFGPLCSTNLGDGGAPHNDGGSAADAGAPDGSALTTDVQVPTTCTPIPNAPPPLSGAVLTHPTVMGSSCDPVDGGVASGSATATGSPVTICCH